MVMHVNFLDGQVHYKNLYTNKWEVKMRDNRELLLIALFMFLTLMVYLISVANAGEEYHAKIKTIKQQYCFTKIIITTKVIL